MGIALLNPSYRAAWPTIVEMVMSERHAPVFYNAM